MDSKRTHDGLIGKKKIHGLKRKTGRFEKTHHLGVGGGDPGGGKNMIFHGKKT